MLDSDRDSVPFLSRLTNLVPPDGGAADGPGFLLTADAEDWQRLERFTTRRRFSRGEEIVREGDVDRSLLILLRGQLEFVSQGRALGVTDAPALLGEVAFFDPGPRSGTLRAHTDGELLKLPFPQFEALAASSPSLARRILLDTGRVLAIRVRRFTEEQD